MQLVSLRNPRCYGRRGGPMRWEGGESFPLPPTCAVAAGNDVFSPSDLGPKTHWIRWFSACHLSQESARRPGPGHWHCSQHPWLSRYRWSRSRCLEHRWSGELNLSPNLLQVVVEEKTYGKDVKKSPPNREVWCFKPFRLLVDEDLIFWRQNMIRKTFGKRFSLLTLHVQPQPASHWKKWKLYGCYTATLYTMKNPLMVIEKGCLVLFWTKL